MPGGVVVTLNKQLLALAACLSLVACGPETPAEKAADKARYEAAKAEQAAYVAAFPDRLVVCNIETGKAYVAERLEWSPGGAKYELSEFPGPHWKCPTYDNKDKVP